MNENMDKNMNENNEEKPTFKAMTISQVKKENKRNKMMKEISGKKTLTGFIIFVCAIALVFLGLKLNKKMLVLSIGDTNIGIVENRKVLNEYEAKLRKEISEEENVLDVEFKEEIRVDKIKFDKTKLSSSEKVLEGLRNNLTYRIKAYVLVVNSNEVAMFKNKDQFNAVLNRVRNNVYNDNQTFDFANEQSKIKEYFYGSIHIDYKFVDLNELTQNDKLVKRLEEKQESKTYKVKTNDSLIVIANKYDMTVEELLLANRGFTENQVLRTGQEINLVLPMAKLPVIKYTDEEYEAVVEPNVEKIINNDQYEDYQSVIEAGSEGKKRVNVRIKMVDDTEIAKEIVKEVVLEEAQTRVIEVGAKKLPNKPEKGLFQLPVRNYRLITEYFGGNRGSYNHKGVDFADNGYSEIYAAYPGKVTFAGYGTHDNGNTGYGYLVIVTHSNGWQTYYAHLKEDSICVEVGDKVDSNTMLALMGSTGDSTGQHLHFELRKNGEHVNPADYIFGIED
ncbi:MAG: peptidoglycan DD-metalloendopeptidase family protein [Clostridia bacterium]|nr:peptidoglycan DD-metalloendopeptidase family protein [Clostridia bacterium]